MARQGLQRIAIVGATGSGKTRLALALVQRLAVPHIELDALFWGPGWQAAARDVFRARVAAAVAGPAWVADGNAHLARDIIWGRATAVVWLDYALPLVLWRLAKRTARRALTEEELWNGNRQRLRDLFGHNSVLLWVLQSHFRHRREYPAELARPEYKHLAVVRLRSPRETERWLISLN